MIETKDAIISFWREAGPKRWFAKDADFDIAVRSRFEATHMFAAARGLDDWMQTPTGALALLLLLDQFPRNMYRGSAHAFATDPLARRFARQSIDDGFDRQAAGDMRAFFYLPFEHAENLADQEACLQLMRVWVSEGVDPNELAWAEKHAAIIRRFGRFPHRNAALGRDTTPAEQAFLDGGGFSG